MLNFIDNPYFDSSRNIDKFTDRNIYRFDRYICSIVYFIDRFVKVNMLQYIDVHVAERQLKMVTQRNGMREELQRARPPSDERAKDAELGSASQSAAAPQKQPKLQKRAIKGN